MNVVVQALQSLTSFIDFIFFQFFSSVFYYFRFVEIVPLLIDTVLAILKFLLAVNRNIVEWVIQVVVRTVEYAHNCFAVSASLLEAVFLFALNIPVLAWSLIKLLFTRLTYVIFIISSYLVTPILNVPTLIWSYVSSLLTLVQDVFIAGLVTYILNVPKSIWNYVSSLPTFVLDKVNVGTKNLIQSILYVPALTANYVSGMVGFTEKKHHDFRGNDFINHELLGHQRKQVNINFFSSANLLQLFQWTLGTTANFASYLGEKILWLFKNLFEISVYILYTLVTYILEFFKISWKLLHTLLWFMFGFVKLLINLLDALLLYMFGFIKLLWNLLPSITDIVGATFSILRTVYGFVLAISRQIVSHISGFNLLIAVLVVITTVVIFKKYSLNQTVAARTINSYLQNLRLYISRRIWRTARPVNPDTVKKEQNHVKLDTVKKEQKQHKEDWAVCVVCVDKRKSVLLLPCKHLCLCGTCVDDILALGYSQHKCPLCRARINDYMTVYL